MSRKSRHTIVASVPEAIETLVATKQRIRENRDRRWPPNMNLNFALETNLLRK
jgi:hypothetical protein